MEQLGVVAGNLVLSFSLNFLSIFVHISASNKPITVNYSAPSCDHFGRHGEWKNIWRLKFWRKSPIGDLKI